MSWFFYINMHVCRPLHSRSRTRPTRAWCLWASSRSPTAPPAPASECRTRPLCRCTPAPAPCWAPWAAAAPPPPPARPASQRAELQQPSRGSRRDRPTNRRPALRTRCRPPCPRPRRVTWSPARTWRRRRSHPVATTTKTQRRRSGWDTGRREATVSLSHHRHCEKRLLGLNLLLGLQVHEGWPLVSSVEAGHFSVVLLPPKKSIIFMLRSCGKPTTFRLWGGSANLCTTVSWLQSRSCNMAVVFTH